MHCHLCKSGRHACQVALMVAPLADKSYLYRRLQLANNCLSWCNVGVTNSVGSTPGQQYLCWCMSRKIDIDISVDILFFPCRVMITMDHRRSIISRRIATNPPYQTTWTPVNPPWDTPTPLHNIMSPTWTPTTPPTPAPTQAWMATPLACT